METKSKELTVFKQQTARKLDDINAITIKTSGDLVMAKDTLVELTRIEKNIKAQEQKISKPLRDSLKATRAFFNPLREKVQEVKVVLKGKVLEYSDMIDAKREAKEAKVTEQVQEGKITVAQASKKLEKIEEKSKAIPTRVLRQIKITNRKIVPQKYWILDLVAIRKHALAGVKIPGVKIIEKKTIVAR